MVTVVAVDIMLTMQEVEAQEIRGRKRSVAANASQGRCVEQGKNQFDSSMNVETVVLLFAIE